jgi:hypothetical protein
MRSSSVGRVSPVAPAPDAITDWSDGRHPPYGRPAPLFLTDLNGARIRSVETLAGGRFRASSYPLSLSLCATSRRRLVAGDSARTSGRFVRPSRVAGWGASSLRRRTPPGYPGQSQSLGSFPPPPRLKRTNMSIAIKTTSTKSHAVKCIWRRGIARPLELWRRIGSTQGRSM